MAVSVFFYSCHHAVAYFVNKSNRKLVEAITGKEITVKKEVEKKIAVKKNVKKKTRKK